MTVVYDAGVLVAADRNDRAIWADHRVRLHLGIAPATTEPVVAQVSRSGRQASLRRFLRGCEVVPFAAGEGHGVGALVGRAGTADVVDAHVVAVAACLGLGVLTSAPDDVQALADATGRNVPVSTIGG